MKIARWVQRHRTIGPWVHRLLHPGHSRYWRHRYSETADCRVCRGVWAEVLSDPELVASLRQGLADSAAGRWYSYERRPDGSRWSVPNPDWPADGEQPHPAERWDEPEPSRGYEDPETDWPHGMDWRG